MGFYLVDFRFPFGLRSYPGVFTRFADAVCWIIQNIYHLPYSIHYSDDLLIMTLHTDSSDNDFEQAMQAFLWHLMPFLFEIVKLSLHVASMEGMVNPVILPLIKELGTLVNIHFAQLTMNKLWFRGLLVYQPDSILYNNSNNDDGNVFYWPSQNLTSDRVEEETSQLREKQLQRQQQQQDRILGKFCLQ